MSGDKVWRRITFDSLNEQVDKAAELVAAAESKSPAGDGPAALYMRHAKAIGLLDDVVFTFRRFAEAYEALPYAVLDIDLDTPGVRQVLTEALAAYRTTVDGNTLAVTDRLQRQIEQAGL